MTQFLRLNAAWNNIVNSSDEHHEYAEL